MTSGSAAPMAMASATDDPRQGEQPGGTRAHPTSFHGLWSARIRRRPVVTPGLAGLVLGGLQRVSEQTPPTERETDVLRMVAKGPSYRQIAARLVLSHRTMHNHVQNTLRELQLHNRVELTRDRDRARARRLLAVPPAPLARPGHPGPARALDGGLVARVHE